MAAKLRACLTARAGTSFICGLTMYPSNLLIGVLLCTLLPLFTTALPHLPRGLTARTFIAHLPESGGLSSITQIKNPRWTRRQISTSLVYAAPFLKNHIPMPANLSAALYTLQSPRDVGLFSSLESRANGQTVEGSDGEFVFPVRVGTPSQTLYVVFDTGSGDFWLWSWQMPTSAIQDHRVYNASNSTTAVRYPGQSFSITYASGSAYGTIWQDTLWVDGNDGSIGVTGNPVECAQNIGGAFATLPAVDGVMGLNTWVNDSELPVPQQTWLSYILSNLAASVFTVALVQGGVGSMDFGFIDSSKYKGSISYTPVVDAPSAPATGFWSFQWSGFAIGSNTFNASVVPVVTDTGGNLVLLPYSITAKYYSYVKGAYQQSDGAWCFPCSSTLPTFTFGVGSGRAVVASKHMIFAGLADGVNCYGAIQPTSETSFAYFGTPFFNALFVVHDYGGHRLGFAARTST